jgi:hypothetical protein
MVWDQEPLLPPHKDDATVSVIQSHMGSLSLMPNVLESWETRPMDDVLVLGCTPVLCEEAIAAADNLSVEISGEFWPIIRQTSYSKIATESRGRKVDIHNGHINVVAVPAAFLGSLKGGSWI